MPTADAPSPVGPSGVVPVVNWGIHVFPPGFPSQATTTSMQPVQKVLFLLCFNPAIRSPSSLVGVTLAVLGPQPWPPSSGGTMDHALQTGEPCLLAAGTPGLPGTLPARMVEII